MAGFPGSTYGSPTCVRARTHEKHINPVWRNQLARLAWTRTTCANGPPERCQRFCRSPRGTTHRRLRQQRTVECDGCADDFEYCSFRISRLADDPHQPDGGQLSSHDAASQTAVLT